MKKWEYNMFNAKENSDNEKKLLRNGNISDTTTNTNTTNTTNTSGISSSTPNNTSTSTNQSNLPSLSLPKGGGAIRGIGEKFTANSVTGTGSLSVPIFTSPGRSGFGPQMQLTYDSGSGNGPFGLGWNLTLPSITRKTDKGLPKYQDDIDVESDVFILSGFEDLVPSLIKVNGQWKLDSFTRQFEGIDYLILRYKPRIEGLFALIERWTSTKTGEIHWKSISKDNVTTIYGKTPESRIGHPVDSKYRIFSWLICESYDDKGNAMVYEYKAENSHQINLSSFVHEQNRTDQSRSTNRYIKRIKYGNRTPRSQNENLSTRNDWMFELVFDYGEHYTEDSQGQPIDVFVNDINNSNRQWQVREDPFSIYRAGFEIRTYRLCQRVLMFHHFPEEIGTHDYLVRATEFAYIKSPIASFITSITQSGYLRQDDGTYKKKSIPPIEFEYSKATIQDEIREIDKQSLENLPSGIDGTLCQWVDLDGEGLAGILTEQAGSWFYKHNISSLPVTGADGKPVVVARFEPLQLEATVPSLSNFNEGRQQLMDLAGDGKIDLVKFDRFVSGYFKRSFDGDDGNSSGDRERWRNFTPFSSLPNIPWNDPNLKFVDLTGDGHADLLLITDDLAFTWYHSLAEKGFGKEGEKTYQSLDEEKGPRLVFADSTQSIYLADMSGDGLTDLVRIRNGEVCYWPNRGYGHFGFKVTLDNSPCFDNPDKFDQRRVRLADIDGSGTTDIIHLGCNGIDVYFNQSGNILSDKNTLYTSFPHIDQLSSVMVVDLLGNGTACLVWSSPLPGDSRRPMHYIDLMGGQKPHLLTLIKNNMGAETSIKYAPSTKFYLADKLEGRPWITKLPFPVYVVEKVETYDRISRNLFVTRYAYHHGYFDGIEREFRGFGMVEQFDTEEFAALNTVDTFPSTTNVEESSHVPPVKTKTWFHTGAYLLGDYISHHYREEYYGMPKKSDTDYVNKFKAFENTLLEDTVLPPEEELSSMMAMVTPDEEREACRALKGSILRQEMYALDSLPNKSEHPYSVSEYNYTIKRIQPQINNNNHGVFFVHSRETLDYHYERNPDDPRLSHTLTLKVDKYGNIVKSASIGYGRLPNNQDPNLSTPDQIKQGQLLIMCIENTFTNSIVPIKPDHSDGDIYRTPLPCESRNYELTGLNPLPNNKRFDFATVDNAITNAGQIEYQEKPSSTMGLQKRLIDHSCTLYRKDNLDGPLPLEQIEPLGLVYETYKQAFTPGLVSQIYGGRVTDTLLLNEGGYIHFIKDLSSSANKDPNWWIPSGRIFYSPNEDDVPTDELNFARDHFFLLHRLRDPFQNGAATNRKDSKITYDKYSLLIQETRDPLDNAITVVTKNAMDKTIIALDYRVLQPWMVTDSNNNRTEVAYDILGLVVGTAVMGKVEEIKGDSLVGFEPNLDEATILSHIQNPFTSNPHDILKKATTRIIYDLYQYKRTSEIPNSELLPNVVYNLVRETHDSNLEVNSTGVRIPTRIQHIFSYSDGFGREIQKKIQAVPGNLDNGTFANLRWVGNGWIIFNNKGKPVKKYEPFFSDTSQFEFAKKVGVSSTLFYDPLERVVATLYPNHTYEKMVFDTWRQEIWDVNDTVLQTDPKDDAYVKGFFERLPDDEYLKTWYEGRKNGQKGLEEQDAAQKTTTHANTPTISYFDSLGRTFLTIADNGKDVNGKEVIFKTRVELDIEGNQHEVIDTFDRKVMIYDYDMLKNQIKHASMDAGERWSLNNVVGKPIYNWDSLNHTIHTDFDDLHRPITIHSIDGIGTVKTVESIVYGEVIGTSFNHRGKIYQHYDGAGLVTNNQYDFKGNLLSANRQLSTVYNETLDWSNNAGLGLESEIFTTATEYDALNRPVKQFAPHNGGITHFVYNEAGLLEQVEAKLPNGENFTTIIEDINYDSKGQRTFIRYGNGIETIYDYDKETFKLIRLQTQKGSTKDLQNLSYTYDPIGNIIHIHDNTNSQNIIFLRNAEAKPSSDYIYDPMYRLIFASGREHLGQLASGGLRPPEPTSNTDEPRVNLFHPNDWGGIKRYEENYIYDEVGNMRSIVHSSTEPSLPGWTRTYKYDINKNNRLLSTSTDNNNTIDPYFYDAHGNTIGIPHLAHIDWNYLDQLVVTSSQNVSEGNKPETTYYVYDSAGQRVRKVTEGFAEEGQNPRRLKERIYLGGYEIYRKYNGSGKTVNLERETLHIMGDSQLVALVETLAKGDDDSPLQTIRYQLTNHLGSSILELDETARIISYEEYYPYGSTAYQAASNLAEIKLKRYRYTGKERDEETGFYYYGARYYSPWLGRWISCDPIGLQEGANLYLYAHLNPVKLIDLNGKQSMNKQEDIQLPEIGLFPPKSNKSLGDFNLKLLSKNDPLVQAHSKYTFEQKQDEPSLRDFKPYVEKKYDTGPIKPSPYFIQPVPRMSDIPSLDKRQSLPGPTLFNEDSGLKDPSLKRQEIHEPVSGPDGVKRQDLASDLPKAISKTEISKEVVKTLLDSHPKNSGKNESNSTSVKNPKNSGKNESNSTSVKNETLIDEIHGKFNPLHLQEIAKIAEDVGKFVAKIPGFIAKIPGFIAKNAESFSVEELKTPFKLDTSRDKDTPSQTLNNTAKIPDNTLSEFPTDVNKGLKEDWRFMIMIDIGKFINLFKK